MKKGFKHTIGKTIKEVVVSEQHGQGQTWIRNQIFIVFTDNTFIEIFGSDDMNCTSSLSRGTVIDAIEYAKIFKPTDITVYPEMKIE